MLGIPDLQRKARRHLNAARASAQQLRLIPDGVPPDQVEATFFQFVTELDALAQAIFELSRLVDSGVARQRLLSDRSSDPALFYFWKARVADHHASGMLDLKPNFVEAHIRVVDADRTHLFMQLAHGIEAESRKLLMMHVFAARDLADLMARLEAGAAPLPENCEFAGVVVESLFREPALRDFEFTNLQRVREIVPAPHSHGGVTLPPAFVPVGNAVLGYFEQMILGLGA